jgi:hypothetical protein
VVKLESSKPGYGGSLKHEEREREREKRERERERERTEFPCHVPNVTYD